MKQLIINLLTITPRKAAFIQGMFIGLFISMGIFNGIDGAFFSKNVWQSACGINQVIIGALIFKA